ncbi:hypothetical protein CBS101457_003958 [Exobasidium rhododendri]|nr:hypothetical protein CBS101457_003958 [Exobasidium rhododendri]
MIDSHHLTAPLLYSNKRSRSDSSSSSSSSSAASSIGVSSSSQSTSADSLSSCSSPAVSNDASPCSVGQEDERPCKTLRTGRSSSAEVSLEGLKSQCTLNNAGYLSRQPSPESDKITSTVKNIFVDCLVDAAVHVLDIIWQAPLPQSIAFVCDDTSDGATPKKEATSLRSCKCPAGQPVTAGIPLDLFVRETLRRSRTSCSTLQAALLFCKRAGGEVIRQRACKEGFALSAKDLERLPGSTQTYASLTTTSSDSPNDYILCSRRIFLASVMVSSKFLQDRTFSNRAWSKISGLNVRELCVVERRLLMALEFDLNVCEKDWATWTLFLKGEWKARQLVTQQRKSVDQNGASPCSLAAITTGRSSLERTYSLQREEVFDTDLALPTGDEKMFFKKGEKSAEQTYSPICISTPVLPTSSTHHKDDASSTILSTFGTGESTPTASKITRSSLPENRKIEPSLLSTALHNHMLSVDGSTQLASSDLPLPYPFLRKGLANRSISSF